MTFWLLIYAWLWSECSKGIGFESFYFKFKGSFDKKDSLSMYMSYLTPSISSPCLLLRILSWSNYDDCKVCKAHLLLVKKLIESKVFFDFTVRFSLVRGGMFELLIWIPFQSEDTFESQSPLWSYQLIGLTSSFSFKF